MTKLFEPALVDCMSLNNRFVRSATWEGLADLPGSFERVTALFVTLVCLILMIKEK